MTLYQVCQRINDSLEIEDNLVFNYLIWGTTDNGNFLRTQHCKRHNALQDKELGFVKHVVLGMQQRFNTLDFVFNQNSTNAKVQVFWCDSASKAKEVVEINSNLGYTYNITIVI